jgi:hypothetical protein
MYGKLMISLLATRILSISHVIQGGFHDTSSLCLTVDPGSLPAAPTGIWPSKLQLDDVKSKHAWLSKMVLAYPERGKRRNIRAK